jgi:hypothetical protein
MTNIITATITTVTTTGVQFYDNSVCTDTGNEVSGLVVSQLFAVMSSSLQTYRQSHRSRIHLVNVSVST